MVIVCWCVVLTHFSQIPMNCDNVIEAEFALERELTLLVEFIALFSLTNPTCCTFQLSLNCKEREEKIWLQFDFDQSELGWVFSKTTVCVELQ